MEIGFILELQPPPQLLTTVKASLSTSHKNRGVVVSHQLIRCARHSCFLLCPTGTLWWQPLHLVRSFPEPWSHLTQQTEKQASFCQFKADWRRRHPRLMSAGSAAKRSLQWPVASSWLAGEVDRVSVPKVATVWSLRGRNLTSGPCWLTVLDNQVLDNKAFTLFVRGKKYLLWYWQGLIYHSVHQHEQNT